MREEDCGLAKRKIPAVGLRLAGIGVLLPSWHVSAESSPRLWQADSLCSSSSARAWDRCNRGKQKHKTTQTEQGRNREKHYIHSTATSYPRISIMISEKLLRPRNSLFNTENSTSFQSLCVKSSSPRLDTSHHPYFILRLAGYSAESNQHCLETTVDSWVLQLVCKAVKVVLQLVKAPFRDGKQSKAVGQIPILTLIPGKERLPLAHTKRAVQR